MGGCRALSEEQVKAIARGLDDTRARALFFLGIGTGLRISEMLAVELRFLLDGARGFRAYLELPAGTTGKTHRHRSIALGHTVKRELARHIETLGNRNGYTLLFRKNKRRNEAIGARQARRILKDAFSAAGLGAGYSCHSLRKTFAERVYAATSENFFLTAAALGHLSPASTVHYLSLHTARVDEAVRAALDGMGVEACGKPVDNLGITEPSSVDNSGWVPPLVPPCPELSTTFPQVLPRLSTGYPQKCQLGGR